MTRQIFLWLFLLTGLAASGQQNFTPLRPPNPSSAVIALRRNGVVSFIIISNLSFNPTVEKSFAGPDVNQGLIFSPNLKGSYNVSNLVALGLEYYGSTGPFFHYYDYQQQEHQLFAATDLNFNPNWEFNAGVGYGFTNSTDKVIVKIILGRRF